MLKPYPCIDLLGVLIDVRLSFDEQVSSICNRVWEQINALSRANKCLTLENRLFIYHGVLPSNIHYCNVVWYMCNNRSMHKLEKGHKQALRVVRNDFTSSCRVLLDKHFMYPNSKLLLLKIACCLDENPKYTNVMLVH